MANDDIVPLLCILQFIGTTIICQTRGQYIENLRKLFPSRINPCSYPSPVEKDFYQRCHITDNDVKRYEICDPESAVSMSEVSEIVEELEKTYLKKDALYRHSCVCKDDEPHSRCWYKFGFAFLKELPLPIYQLSENIGAEICMGNWSDENNLVNRRYVDSIRAVQTFGNLFADILRQRWKLGKCGEDVLFLIVRKRPHKVIFMSTGEMVAERTGHLYVPHMNMKTLKHIVRNINRKFESEGLGLKPAYEHLIEQFVEMLSLGASTIFNFEENGCNHVDVHNSSICGTKSTYFFAQLMTMFVFVPSRFGP